VRFAPRSVGPVFGFLSIRTLGNPFEDVNIKLCGEGYSDDVTWDLSEVHTASKLRKEELTKDELSEAALPPGPDHLDLGEVAVGGKAEAKFQLKNAAHQLLRYEFPADMPAVFGQQLVIQNRVGFVQPNSEAEILLVFQPTQKVEVQVPVSIACQTFAVTIDETEPNDADEGHAGEGEAGEAIEQEPAFTEIAGTRKEVPLKVSAMADEHSLAMKLSEGVRGERADFTEINFSPTMMFASKTFRFVIENHASIIAPCDFQIQGKTAGSFEITPSQCIVPANGEKEVEVRFSPKEVEHFDCTLLRTLAGAPEEVALVRIPLTGAALRPWCHIELPPSDYRSRRQSETPLDPKCRIIEIVSLGTHVKNTKRFYVLNPTSKTIRFEWRPADRDAAADEAFRCLAKSGEIRPDKKFEMVFEFAPLTTDTRESFWRFLIMIPTTGTETLKIEEQFLLVGMVQEPCVGFNSPAINFGERLIDGETTETVQLVNKEIIPFGFAFDQSSFQVEGQPHVVSVSPMSGVVGPDTSQEVEVTFKPVQERPFNFNVVCNVKRKKEPVVLNVKGVGYKIHASLSAEESDTSGRRILQTGVVELLDFGVLQVQESRTIKLFLKNDSKRNFNFRVLLQSGASRRPLAITSAEKPPYIDIAQNDEGIARHHEEAEINIKYSPKDVHNLDGSILHVVIPTGTKDQGFKVMLTGGAKRSRLDFSFYDYNFGPCFISHSGATMAGVPLSNEDEGKNQVKLVVTNRDDTDVLLSTTFQREAVPYLDLKFRDTMVPAGGFVEIPIVFAPTSEHVYEDTIGFLVNEYTTIPVRIRGEGTPLRLELSDLKMQNLDFGVTTGGKQVSKNARVVNRSARAVTFQLCDESDMLGQKGVTWTPAHQTTLRPRESLDINLRFMPMYKIPPFRIPLVAKCDHGVDVRLMQVSGTCHATEVRLSEHAVFFGEVVRGSHASKLVKLHNFGDLGAKFRFEMPSRFQGIYSISPAEGFVRPQEEVPLTLSFHPLHERMKPFLRAQKSTSNKNGKADGFPINLTVKDIRCTLDGHPPLTLEASGVCVDQPKDAQQLDFVTEVRQEQVNTVRIKNTSNTDWKLTPQVTTDEPKGTKYWTCAPEVPIGAGKEEEVKIIYRPLTMTEPEGDEASAGKKREGREAKHEGTLFIGTPDGKAFLYNLVGIALAPRNDPPITERVPCKKQHSQKVKIKNWLQDRQRFSVNVELVDPAPASREAQGIIIRAVDTLDLPAGLEREYRFNIYAYHERSATVRVTFLSKETGEFKVVEVNFTFFAAESLGAIQLEAACRQQTRHKISVANPLDTEAKFRGTSTNPYITFSDDPLVVPPNSEKSIELLFRPVEESRGEAEVTLKSDELGTYPYTVHWVATAAGLDRTLVLKAPLGGSSVEEYKFIHYARQQVSYSASVEPMPGHKGVPSDFHIEPGQDLNKPAAGPDGAEANLAVRFRPSVLGECKALLVVKGPGGGEYKAMLTGFAQPPQPQGPYTVPNGKGDAKVEFRNPFDKPTEFKFQIDNPSFAVAQSDKRMDPGEVVQISVSFKSDRPQGGRLIISTDKVATPWIFFLKGEL
jgi:hydrocephalus-inducing protein